MLTKKKECTAFFCVLLIGVGCYVGLLLKARYSYIELPYQSPPYENPLRGLVYSEQSELPQSLVYFMIPFSDFYDQNGAMTFDIFEKNLAAKTERGSQTVIRVFISYPGDERENFTGLYLPPHLYKDLNNRKKIFSKTNQSGVKAEFPDYGDDRLMEELVRFIKQFGALYDNDPRIGFIQLGLVGNWGEWNFFPFDEQMTLTPEDCNTIYQAYQDAFPTTKLMVRNPLMGNAVQYKIGFHDDNYLSNTVSLEPVTEENINDIAQFQYMMEKSGTHDKWKTEAYGGELSGTANLLFYEGLGYEYYKKSMEIFHFSFLSLPIPTNPSESFYKAMEATRLMGYEFTIDKARLIPGKNKIYASVSLSNTGNAPFYYNWDFEIRIVNKNGNVVAVYPLAGHVITDILPRTSKLFHFVLEGSNAYGCDVQFAIVSPMREIVGDYYKPLYLANKDQKGDGFVSLGAVRK